MPALHDVLGYAIKVNARAAGHATTLREPLIYSPRGGLWVSAFAIMSAHTVSAGA